MPDDQLLDSTIGIQCAHRDCVEYPLAEVDIAVDDEHVKILVGAAGVAERLLTAMLLVRMCQDSGICWGKIEPRQPWWLRLELQPNVKQRRLQNRLRVWSPPQPLH